MSRDPAQTIDRLAHAFDPSGWKKRNLVLASVALITVVGSLLLAMSALVQRTRLAQAGLLGVVFFGIPIGSFFEAFGDEIGA